MARTEQPQPVQKMGLHRIHRPLHGWRRVYVALHDGRLHLLLDRMGDWHFGVLRLRWQHGGNDLEWRRGPFPSQAEAEAAARRWFLGNPAGPAAELLALDHPLVPGVRPLLAALNGGDPAAGAALLDLAREAGADEPLVGAVEGQLVHLGVWPVGAQGRITGILAPRPVRERK
jgi:hypothetical protein